MGLASATSFSAVTLQPLADVLLAEILAHKQQFVEP